MPVYTFDDHQRLVFDTSRWQHLLYTSRHAAAEGLRDAHAAVYKAVATDARVDGDDEFDLGAADRAADAFTGETFARLYNDPARLAHPNADHPWAARAHELLDAIPEFDGLREVVSGDPDLTTFATQSLVSAVAAKLGPVLAEERARREQEAREQAAREQANQDGDENGDAGQPGQGDGADGEPGDGDGDADTDGDGDGQDGEGQAPAPAPPREPTHAEAAMRAALRSAVKAATAKAEQAKAALASLGCGADDVPPQHEQPDPSRYQLADQLLKTPDLREVLRRAGKLRRLAESKERIKTDDARSEVVGLERGDDLARILPSELAGLKHPKMRLLALRNIAERSALQYKLIGDEPLGRGPIVVLVDESGSMMDNDGEPNRWAKAVAIACIMQGLKERREVTVIPFGDAVHAVLPVNKARLVGDRVAHMVYHPTGSHTLPNKGAPASEMVLHLAGRGAGGGTSFEAPFRFALDTVAASDRPDIVFVTDGQADVRADILARVVDARERRGLRVFGVTVNGGSVSGAVRDLCTEAVDIDRVVREGGDVADAVAGSIPTKRA